MSDNDEDETYEPCRKYKKKKKAKLPVPRERPKREVRRKEVTLMAPERKWTTQDKEKLTEVLYRHSPSAIESIANAMGNKTPKEVDDFIKKTINSGYKDVEHRKINVIEEKSAAPLELWMSLVHKLVEPQKRPDFSAHYSKVFEMIGRNELVEEESGIPNLNWSNLYRYVSDLLNDKAVLQPLSDMESLVILDMMHSLGDTLHTSDTAEKRKILDLKYQLYSRQVETNGKNFTAGHKALLNDFSNVVFHEAATAEKLSKLSTSTGATCDLSTTTPSGTKGSQSSLPTNLDQPGPSSSSSVMDISHPNVAGSLQNSRFTPYSGQEAFQAGFIQPVGIIADTYTVSYNKSHHPASSTADTSILSTNLVSSVSSSSASTNSCALAAVSPTSTTVSPRQEFGNSQTFVHSTDTTTISTQALPNSSSRIDQSGKGREQCESMTNTKIDPTSDTSNFPHNHNKDNNHPYTGSAIDDEMATSSRLQLQSQAPQSANGATSSFKLFPSSKHTGPSGVAGFGSNLPEEEITEGGKEISAVSDSFAVTGASGPSGLGTDKTSTFGTTVINSDDGCVNNVNDINNDVNDVNKDVNNAVDNDVNDVNNDVNNVNNAVDNDVNNDVNDVNDVNNDTGANNGNNKRRRGDAINVSLPQFFSLNPLTIPPHMISFRPKLSLDKDTPVIIDLKSFSKH